MQAIIMIPDVHNALCRCCGRRSGAEREETPRARAKLIIVSFNCENKKSCASVVLFARRFCEVSRVEPRRYNGRERTEN